MAGERRYKSVSRRTKLPPMRVESIKTPESIGIENKHEELGRSVVYRRHRKFGAQRLLTEVSTTKNKVFIICKDTES